MLWLSYFCHQILDLKFFLKIHILHMFVLFRESASYYLTSLLETQASLSNSIILIRRIEAASNTISIVSDSYFFAISCCDAKKFLLSLKDTVLSLPQIHCKHQLLILSSFLERSENNLDKNLLQ